MAQIYEYISSELKGESAARRLIEKVNERILRLEDNPEMYMKIGTVDKLEMAYHRIIVKNYIILYTIDYKDKKVFVSRIIYSRSNYLNFKNF